MFTWVCIDNDWSKIFNFTNFDCSTANLHALSTNICMLSLDLNMINSASAISMLRYIHNFISDAQSSTADNVLTCRFVCHQHMNDAASQNTEWCPTSITRSAQVPIHEIHQNSCISDIYVVYQINHAGKHLIMHSMYTRIVYISRKREVDIHQ